MAHTAEMIELQASRDRAYGNLICNTVSAHRAGCPQLKRAITIGGFPASPKPTFTECFNVDLSPITLESVIIEEHRKLLIYDVIGRGACNAAAFNYSR